MVTVEGAGVTASGLLLFLSPLGKENGRDQTATLRLLPQEAEGHLGMLRLFPSFLPAVQMCVVVKRQPLRTLQVFNDFYQLLPNW